MYKYLTPATAIALALGLQGCGTMPALPKLDLDGALGGHADAKDMSQMKGQMNLAEASMAAGDPATAIRIYRELARQYPLSITPRIKLGEALLASNAPQEAARAFAGANGINETYDGLVGLGRVELALRDPARALEQFDRAAKIKPDDSVVMNGRAVSLDQLGRHDEAQAIYLVLLQKEPSNLKVRNNYALSLALAGKYDDATDILTSLAQVPDSEERIRQNLALVYGLQGNDGQAAHIGRMDLDEDAVNNNLKYYQTLRNLNSPAATGAALSHPAPNPFMTDNGDASGQKTAGNAEFAFRNVEATSISHSADNQTAARTPKRVHNAKGGLALPMTRAEAASEAPSGNTGATAPRVSPPLDVVTNETTSDEGIFDAHSQALGAPAPVKAKVKAAAKAKPAQVALAAPAAPVASKPVSHHKADQATASSKVRLPAVPALKQVADNGGQITGTIAKPAKTASKNHKKGARAAVLDANPIDTGIRVPAVPAVL